MRHVVILASGPITRCLFIDYLIKFVNNFVLNNLLPKFKTHLALNSDVDPDKFERSNSNEMNREEHQTSKDNERDALNSWLPCV